MSDEKRGICQFIGVALVIAGLVFAFFAINPPAGYYKSYSDKAPNVTEMKYVSFGGDAYTEQYAAMAFAGNIAQNTFRLIAAGFSVLFVSSGSLVVLLFRSRMTCSSDSKSFGQSEWK